jgi:predicted nucleotidyltransferase
MQLTDAQRETIMGWAERTPEVGAVILFGSRAKNKAKLYSDVDLAVVMTEGPDRDQRADNYLRNWKAWNSELTAALGLPAGVFALDPALGPEVPGYVVECSIELWRRAS